MIEVIESNLKQIETQLQQCTSQYQSFMGAKLALEKVLADAKSADAVVQEVSPEVVE